MNHPALVSVKWLAERVASSCKTIRIIDASWHLPNTGRNAREEYSKEHITGALFFDIDECANKSIPMSHMIPSPSQFEEYVGNLGVNNDTHVVVYDNNAKFGVFSAQRVWWTFRLFGYNAVSILEGGLPSWIAKGEAVTGEGTTPVQKQKFVSKFRPELVKNFEDIEENITKNAFQLVDARPNGRFIGKSPEPRADIKPGHIPNSRNLPFTKIMDQETRKVLDPAELKKLFDEVNVDLQKPIVASCGSGISACSIALAAYLCGKDDVAVYDGSWTEWYQRAKPEQKVDCPE
ncbi:3-mercaptopyruvate sulfurtransferase [Patella vulgata]|uniref:3-mercaptopyruvate sulfurtransferase n=1 Tax=Patella vulgata TaxID=6465 RepID=UPI00217F60B1|nr:3-mercaptopyruvate sulfurtransferase [Patella vulgata]XP_050393082.1 3-mercaptopyruvate sulfurtransferase [Patella vulgata]